MMQGQPMHPLGPPMMQGLPMMQGQPMPGQSMQAPQMHQAPLKYEIKGGCLQVIRFMLDPGQQVIGEAGAMLFIDEGITFESRMGDGSLAKEDQGWWASMKAGFKRVISNESLFNTWFTNSTPVPRAIGMAAPLMGSFVPLKLHELPGSMITCQGGAFVCCSPGVVISIALTKSFGAGFFGGEGFILQTLTAQPNSFGECFIQGGGTIIRKELNNEELNIDTGCLMAFTQGVNYEIGFQGWGNSLRGGDMIITKMSGTGSVWIQSTPESKPMDSIIANIPRKGD